MALTFTLLLIGLVLLYMVHFLPHDSSVRLTMVAGYESMACALCALCMMAAAIYAQVFERGVFLLGKPWLFLSEEG